VVGWQKEPALQSLLLVQLPPVPGSQEWRVGSQVMPPEQSALVLQKPPSTQTPFEGSQ
jgi:hypothetical protein